MRILIADDNRDITDSLALLLSARGHIVETAYNGFEACDQATHFLPEAALLDIRMPGRHGYEVAGHLRGIGSILEGGIIGMTGEGGPDARRRAVEAGFDHLVIKPTSIDVIAELLARAGGKPSVNNLGP